MKRLLFVDDEISLLNALRRSIARAFQGEQVSIELFDNPLKALERAAEQHFDLVLSDYRMPQMDGIAFLKRFRELQPDAARLILSASTDFDILVNAINEAEVERYVVKPWSDEELAGYIRTALQRAEQRQEDKRLADEMRLQQGELSAEELELRRLEAEEPGITQVHWGPDGSVIIDDE